MKAGIYNMDCMKAMEVITDNFFELAIVDPPYGLNFGLFNRTNKTDTGIRIKANKYKQANWDKQPPSESYFKALKRVSKQQIVWGGNYFPYLWKNGCKGFIFWYKGQPVDNFSDGELAWASFNRPAKQFDYRYYGNLEGNSLASNKIHPTQKPIKLYEWLLMNYAKEGDLILDTHLGSGSNAIAAHRLGYEFWGFEIDKDYYDAAIKRLNLEKTKLQLF